MATHVYHWKHGWIPLDHAAALSKAKGNHKAAAKMLEDAHGPGAGIHSREHVAKAAVGLSSIPDAGHRAAALSEVHAAADRHNAHDVLPTSLQKPGGTSGPTGALWRVKAHEVQAGDTLHVPSAMGGSTKRYRIDKTHGPKSDGGVNVDATNLETGRPVELTLQGDKKHDIAKRQPVKTPEPAAPKAAAAPVDKPAPKGRAKGIVLDGRTDENRYHYRNHDGTLEPQTDMMVNRLKRVEASHRKAEREGKVFEAHKARKEFASLTGEYHAPASYQPGAIQRGKAAGLPDGYSVKRDVIDGYGPVSTFSVHGPNGERVAQAVHSEAAAHNAATKHHARATAAEADRKALQERIAADKAAKEAAHAKVVADGKAAFAKPDTVDVADQVATNHLVERMHNSGASMSPGELSKIAGSSHVAQHHRDRAQSHLNDQAARRVQFMEGANDARAVQARLVDARQSMPAGPMRTALIHALEQRLASLR